MEVTWLSLVRAPVLTGLEGADPMGLVCGVLPDGGNGHWVSVEQARAQVRVGTGVTSPGSGL